MSDDVIAGTYADIKTIKTRGVVQIVVEIPIERGEEVVALLGFPQPSKEVPVAIARLKAEMARVDDLPPPPSAAHKHVGKRSWSEMTKAQPAGLLCSAPDFLQWLRDEKGINIPGERAAAAYVREYCGVETRADIDEGQESMLKWEQIVYDFRSYTGRVAEAR